MKTAQWTYRQAPWFGNGWTKIHAFDPCDDPHISCDEITLCGRNFNTLTNRDLMRAQAYGHSQHWYAHQCDIEIDLEAVECKHCRRAMERLRCPQLS